MSANKNPFAPPSSSSNSKKKKQFTDPEEGTNVDDEHDVDRAERISLLTSSKPKSNSTTPSSASSSSAATAKSKRLLQETINAGIGVAGHLKGDGELIDRMIERGRYHNQEIESADALLRRMERRRNMYKGIVVGVIAVMILLLTWLFGKWWKGKLKVFGEG